MHHKNPKMKKFAISSCFQVKNINNATILKEIDKCMVVCANCHRKLTWNKHK